MKSIYILLFISIVNFNLLGQYHNTSNRHSDDDKFVVESYYLDGNDYFEDEYYKEALFYYSKAYDIEPTNMNINYKMGLCYLYTNDNNKALKHLSVCKDCQNVDFRFIHYNLGKVYHKLGNFDNAIEEFKSDKRINISKIDRDNKKIAECEQAKLMCNKKIDGLIINLKAINSEYPEYGPMLTSDENTMIFTSRRPNNLYNKKKSYDNKYNEDIYLTTRVKDVWQTPKIIKGKVNTKYHDSNVGLSCDGKTLFIYRGTKNNGDIYKSKLVNNKWTKPKALPKQINSKSTETSVSLSHDENTIYFISNKEGSIGGKDIYYCTKLKNGKWSESKNIGSQINTLYDEEAVYIHPDGKTLYFSSRGHNTMGGFDIFKSEMNEKGEWSSPENMGYPINSVNDDIFFYLSADSKRGYYSTTKTDGLGGKDIYMIEFNNKEIINVKEQISLFEGELIDKYNNLLTNAQISIIDIESEETIETVISDSITGKFIVNLPLGKEYKVEIKKKGYINFSNEINTIDSVINLNVELKIGIPGEFSDSPIITRNILFDFDRYSIHKSSKEEIERVYILMKDNPNLVVEISGNTDSIGSYSYNKMLSEKRADAVVNNLINKGVKKSRFVSIGNSLSKPIADNKLEKGRAMNRRVEVKVLDNNNSK